MWPHSVASIAIRGLSRRFGSHAAVSPMDMDVADGEFVTLLGPSGCGKTTTLRLLAGFMAPDAGEIRVDGRLLSSPAGVVPPERRQMGMVFQSYALWPHLSVFENVAFGLRVQRLAGDAVRGRVDRALELVGLAGLGARSPQALSGGQQQRVALARSLVTEPAILLLDEPLSNLDVKLRERMRDELKALQRRTGITFVYVTHDQAEAIAMSDRIAVMEGGVLRQYATPLDIYERPADRFVADFMGAANLLDGTVEMAPDGAPDGTADGAGRGRVRLAGGQALLMALPAGLPVGSAATVMLRPEDLELAATDAGRTNALAATVVQASLLGHAMEYQVKVGEAEVRVHARRDSGHKTGQAVFLVAPPERCVLVPERPA